MKTLLASSILVICLAMFGIGCSDNNSGAEPDTKVETRSDIAITTELKAKITDDELLDGSDVNVDTQNGVVTLKGTVKSDAQETRALEIAKNTEGVVSVDSQLTLETDSINSPTGEALKDKTKEIGQDVKETAKDVTDKAKKEYGEAADATSDARITSEIKVKFAADQVVKALNINVDTNNGVVTLRGTVNSKAELDQSILLANSVKGVKKVNSELQIAK